MVVQLQFDFDSCLRALKEMNCRSNLNRHHNQRVSEKAKRERGKQHLSHLSGAILDLALWSQYHLRKQVGSSVKPH